MVTTTDPKNSFQESTKKKWDIFHKIEETTHSKPRQDMEQVIHGVNSDMISLNKLEEILSRKQKANSKTRLSKVQASTSIKLTQFLFYDRPFIYFSNILF